MCAVGVCGAAGEPLIGLCVEGLCWALNGLPAGPGADGVFCPDVRAETVDSNSRGHGKFWYISVPSFPAHLKMVSAKAGKAANSGGRRIHVSFDTIGTSLFLSFQLCGTCLA